MKRFVFSLQKLLEARLALEESAQRRLADGLRCLQIGKEELALLVECLQRESQRLEELKGQQTSKHELIYLARFRQGAQQQVRRQVQVVRKYEINVSEYREQLRQIMIKRKSLEHLRDQEHKQWLLEQRRQEQKNNDEISTQRYFRQTPNLCNR